MADIDDELDTQTLLIIQAIAQAMPGSQSCECYLSEDFVCGYCRFVAAGIYDHLHDSGWRISRWDALIDGVDDER